MLGEKAMFWIQSFYEVKNLAGEKEERLKRKFNVFYSLKCFLIVTTLTNKKNFSWIWRWFNSKYILIYRIIKIISKLILLFIYIYKEMTPFMTVTVKCTKFLVKNARFILAKYDFFNPRMNAESLALCFA